MAEKKKTTILVRRGKKLNKEGEKIMTSPEECEALRKAFSSSFSISFSSSFFSFSFFFFLFYVMGLFREFSSIFLFVLLQC